MVTLEPIRYLAHKLLVHVLVGKDGTSSKVNYSVAFPVGPASPKPATVRLNLDTHPLERCQFGFPLWVSGPSESKSVEISRPFPSRGDL